MKNSILSGLFIGALFLAPFILIDRYYHRNHIEQKVYNGNFNTYVWVDFEIAKCWHDPIDSMNMSFIRRRREQAQLLLDAIKEVKY